MEYLPCFINVQSGESFKILLCKGSLAKTQLRFLSMFLLQRRHFLIREEGELAQERSNQGIGDANKELVKFKHRGFGLIQPNRSTCAFAKLIARLISYKWKENSPALFPLENFLPCHHVPQLVAAAKLDQAALGCVQVGPVVRL